jgi:hypothetical protein
MCFPGDSLWLVPEVVAAECGCCQDAVNQRASDLSPFPFRSLPAQDSMDLLDRRVVADAEEGFAGMSELSYKEGKV